MPACRLKPSMVLALAAVLAVCAAACGWWRWRELADTHAELLERLADDAASAFAAPEGGLAAGDIERLKYPLQRARQFADSNRGRFKDAPWLERFDALTSAYSELVDWLDRARTQPIADGERARARELAGAVAAAATAARDAVAEPQAKAEPFDPAPAANALLLRFLPVG